MQGIDHELVFRRTALSGRAWDRARWHDGRHVVVGGITEPMAWAVPAVENHAEKHRHVYQTREYLSWEEVATRLLTARPIFGPANGRAPEEFTEEPCACFEEDCTFDE